VYLSFGPNVKVGMAARRARVTTCGDGVAVGVMASAEAYRRWQSRNSKIFEIMLESDEMEVVVCYLICTPVFAF
jgi:hypothetical protein